MTNGKKREPIDFVITWVDGSDSEWQKEKAKCQKSNGCMEKNWSTSDIRFRDWGILKYWFRAVEKNAPWVNKIYFVTCGQKPAWLNTENPKLTLVEHKDFMPKEYLPTFNSNAIELNIFRIKGLSDRFVYFNDDMYINKPVKTTDFFVNNMPVLPAGFECCRADYGITNSDINNAKIYNKYFSKADVLKKHWRKILSPRNGKFLIKTWCLMPWKNITSVADTHNASAHTKRTFEEIWSMSPEELDDTSRNKFRKSTDVSHWLAKGWNMLSGNFVPTNPKCTISYAEPINNVIINDIIKGKHKLICVNDFECDDMEFENSMKKLINAFEKRYPQKSSFEK